MALAQRSDDSASAFQAEDAGSTPAVVLLLFPILLTVFALVPVALAESQGLHDLHPFLFGQFAGQCEILLKPLQELSDFF